MYTSALYGCGIGIYSITAVKGLKTFVDQLGSGPLLMGWLVLVVMLALRMHFTRSNIRTSALYP